MIRTAGFLLRGVGVLLGLLMVGFGLTLVFDSGTDANPEAVFVWVALGGALAYWSAFEA